jgi:hypothetical protein
MAILSMLCFAAAGMAADWLTSDFNFGDYLQMIGVHEYRLRHVGDGWPAHEDIEHTPG